MAFMSKKIKLYPPSIIGFLCQTQIDCHLTSIRGYLCKKKEIDLNGRKKCQKRIDSNVISLASSITFTSTRWSYQHHPLASKLSALLSNLWEISVFEFYISSLYFCNFTLAIYSVMKSSISLYFCKFTLAMLSVMKRRPMECAILSLALTAIKSPTLRSMYRL